MRSNIFKPQFIIAALCLIGVDLSAQSSGGFDLSWFTIAVGGATSSAGGASLSSTIGQFDVGTLNSGTFAVGGGFWSATVPSGPTLRIVLSGPTLILSWPDPSTGFALQEASALPALPAAWTNVSQVPSIVNGKKQVTLPRSASKRFYRLFKP